MAFHPLVMPKIGLTMDEGTVAKWHVPEGQAVTPGQHVADIEIEKSTNELESPAGGILAKQVVPEGTVVPVGTLIGVLADGGEGTGDAEAFAADYVPTA